MPGIIEGKDKDVVDHAMRLLWALCERAGGTITITEKEAQAVTGVFHVTWDDERITVSVAAGHSDKKQ